MKGQETDDKTTIKAAAAALQVTTKTIQRYLSKGLLTKIKERNRTYVLLSEVDELRSNPARQGQFLSVARREAWMGQRGDTVTIARERYESLLIELGELRKQSQFLLEFRTVLQEKEETLQARDKDIDRLNSLISKLEETNREKDKALEEVQQKVQQMEATLAESSKLQRPWWQK